MKIKQILNENPSVTEELKEFFLKVILKSLEKSEKVPEDFKNILKKEGITDTLLLGYLESTPRLICDFMDERDVIIGIINHGENHWNFSINGKEDDSYYESRVKAEYASVIGSILEYIK